MGSGPIDPKELLKGLDCFLGRDGEVKSAEGITKIFSLMKDSQKMVSRCIYLNILLQTRAQEILVKFIRIGGYKLLNAWLTTSKATNNVPFLQQLLLTLQHLPLTVDHLKQNNTAKLVKQLSKSSDDEELRRLASILVSDWMGVIRSQSSAQPAERDKKKRKEETKTKTPAQEKPQETKTEAKTEEIPEKKREKPKSQRTTAPSHAKFRSTGLEMETPSLAPVKKMNSSATTDKYNLKPVPIKRQNVSSLPGDAPPAEKKYKPLNTAPNAAKEIKVKIIPPQPMEGLGFLDALNSAPIPGIKIKKKKKVLSPTATKPSPFEGKSVPEASAPKPASPEPSAPEATDSERPGTPVPPVEVLEPMDTGSSDGAGDPKAGESGSESGPPPKKGRKRKTVSWPEENKLREYFYFELDETERVNVNKIKDFGEAAKRELLKDREAFETARRLSHDSMEEKVPWNPPRALALPPPLVPPGSGSRERFTQAEREKGILQEIFLSKESVPDSPHEPDPEPYEPLPPKLIPLDEGGPSPHKAEELLKQPDYSEKIKHLLGNLQGPGPAGVPHGLLGPGPPMANGFAPGHKGMQHFPPGGPLPGPHGGGGGGGGGAPGLPPGIPGGPRMLGPPPPQRGGGDFWDPTEGGGGGGGGSLRGGGAPPSQPRGDARGGPLSPPPRAQRRRPPPSSAAPPLSLPRRPPRGGRGAQRGPPQWHSGGGRPPRRPRQSPPGRSPPRPRWRHVRPRRLSPFHAEGQLQVREQLRLLPPRGQRAPPPLAPDPPKPPLTPQNPPPPTSPAQRTTPPMASVRPLRRHRD
ncbi:serine/threonine-protein phosphatase 1 regulatory subunit 10 isoform X2 [Patagioenas fasciata]|uniref:serine/threonine-protein phosphatase 1 regulatory subunit 10 isoform X2 n=1 Tax=Patagioenas fasciata TaxID=372321 RepID=UPI003A9A41CE